MNLTNSLPPALFTYAKECLPSQEDFTIQERHSDLLLSQSDESATHVQRAKMSGQPHSSGTAVQVACTQRGNNANELNIERTGLGSFNDCFRDALMGGSSFAFKPKTDIGL